MSTDTRVAVVTGASRGLGREVAETLAREGWAVAVTARGEGAAPVVADLRASTPGADVEAFTLDVTDAESVSAMAEAVRQRFGRVDALVNNAAVIFDDGGRPALEQEPSVLEDSFRTNTLGAFRVLQALAPMLRDAAGTVVHVSSGMGALSGMGGGHPGYRLSKAALNALTRIAHAELHPHGVRVNAVCPGWVRTDMGGSGASRSVSEGAAGIVWAATLPSDGPSGGFFRDGKPIDW